MKRFDKMRSALRALLKMCSTQISVSVPPRYKAAFNANILKFNLIRFSLLSVLLFVVNCVSLVVYRFFFIGNGSGFSLFYLAHFVQMAMMAVLFAVFLYKQQSSHTAQTFFNRNIAILFPVLCACSELFLFITGPQDLGALLRLVSVPFVVGTVVIMKQSRSIVLESAVLLVFHYYVLAFTSYGAGVNYPSYFLGVGILFLCAVMLSDGTYSGQVNDFIHNQSEQEAKGELKRLNTRLDILARRDQLTGLSNRRDFDLFMEMSWSAERQRPQTLSIIMIDIDHFKAFNDRFGHVAGDDCLVRVTTAIAGCFHSSEYMFARYGGEEFIIVAFGEQHEEMTSLAERIRKAVQQLHVENPDSSVGPYITVSLGIATQETAMVSDYNTIVNIADECLYYAKAGGRNRLVHIDAQSNSYRNINNKVVRREKTEELPGISPYNTHQVHEAIKGTSLDCTFVYSKKQGILEFSSFAKELLGMPHSIATPSLTKIMETLPIAAEDVQLVHEQLRKAIASQRRALELEARVIGSDRHKRWVTIRAKCLYAEDGTLEVATGTFFTIQNVMDFSNYTYEQSMVDSLTQLPNRKKFYADMQELLTQQGNNGYIALFDINSFRSINGIFSHAIGDRTLKKVGSLMSKMAADEAKVYHYAVDQYAVMLNGGAQRDLYHLVERIQQFFGTCGITVKGISLKIGFNVGAVAFGSEQENLDDLMLNLEIALQKAKLEHKHNFRLFTDEDKTEYMKGIRLEKELVEAVREDHKGFALHYQPLFSQNSDKCVGTEALLRWTKENGEEISPLTVIPVLESNGLIIKAGYWILDEACRQCREWIEGGVSEDFYVHVNLSAHQIDNASFAQDVFGILQENNLQPKNLVLEVTESSFLPETTKSIGMLHTLRNAGVRIAVDDFGTGYSSLSYLRSLPADVIKMDRSFLVDVAKNDSARKILRSVAGLTRSMGYKVCVEGVETPEQMSFLKNSFVDLLQGFLLGRPAPPESFRRQWLDIDMAVAPAALLDAAGNAEG